jgi:3-oxoacyl-[acyl-carrier-protein] synthase-3
VDQLIFTQIIAIAAERCNVPLEKCPTIMQKRGYTGSACIPMALDDAIELGKIKRGDLVVMISSGLGWNQAAAAIRWTAQISRVKREQKVARTPWRERCWSHCCRL